MRSLEFEIVLASILVVFLLTSLPSVVVGVVRSELVGRFSRTRAELGRRSVCWI